MGKKRGKIIVVGIVLACFISLNIYAYTVLKEERNTVSEESKKVDTDKEQLNVLISQLLNKSSQYASHEDMVYAFNLYSASNSFHYQGNHYYADLKRVSSHTYSENEKVRYIAQAEMTFLKDKMVNNMSYIQNELPIKLMADGRAIVENNSSHNHEDEKGHKHEKQSDTLVPKVDMTEIEKTAKKEFEVYKWNQELSFNMEEQTVIQPTLEMEKEILKQFIKGIVLKDEIVEIEIDSSQKVQTIKVKTAEKMLIFTYDGDTKEFKENQ